MTYFKSLAKLIFAVTMQSKAYSCCSFFSNAYGKASRVIEEYPIIADFNMASFILGMVSISSYVASEVVAISTTTDSAYRYLGWVGYNDTKSWLITNGLVFGMQVIMFLAFILTFGKNAQTKLSLATLFLIAQLTNPFYLPFSLLMQTFYCNINDEGITKCDNLDDLQKGKLSLMGLWSLHGVIFFVPLFLIAIFLFSSNRQMARDSTQKSQDKSYIQILREHLKKAYIGQGVVYSIPEPDNLV